MGYVVVDTDSEVVLGLVLCEVVVNCNQLARGGVLGGQAVTAADDLDVGSASLIECGAYVEVPGSPTEPTSLERSRTAIFLQVAGMASEKCFTENGRYRSICTIPTLRPFWLR